MSKTSFNQGETTRAIKDMGDDIKDIKEMVQKQDARLTNLEKWRWLLTGSIIALGITNWPMLSQIIQKISVDFIYSV